MPRLELGRTASILAIMGRINPAIFDVFPPQGPLHQRRFDAVALNPQPLPPRDPWVAAAVHLANRLATLAVESEARGESAGWVAEIIDDWCGTPWPHRWPWPWPGPGPYDGPLPDPWTLASARVAGAVVFASVGARLGEGALRDTFLKGSERLAEAAVGQL